ncbi:MAG: cell division protein FtsZ [Clostridia bacterium]|nr:cell division protein FtsZ [Clostridia bacterium]
MAFFELDNDVQSGVDIRVFGVGGGGNNALNRMIASNIKGVEFIAVNTDRQALGRCSATRQICIGEQITKGNGAGADPQKGAMAAEESIEEIKAAIEGADMVFIATGMGGGTGTGAAPIVAKIAKEMGVLTVGIVTKPFKFEGPRRMAQAERGIAEISKHVDSLVIIPNERLKEISEEKITLINAFGIVDDILRFGVQSISDTINFAGYINLDFADICSVMRGAGLAHMGIGEASGENKTIEATKKAIASPLLETSIEGATGVLLNFTIGRDVALDETDEAASLVAEAASANANIIWGFSVDETFEDTVRVTIIATGFDRKKPVKTFDNNEEINISPIRVKINENENENIQIKPAPQRPAPVHQDEIDADIDDILNIVNRSRKKSVKDDFTKQY